MFCLILYFSFRSPSKSPSIIALNEWCTFVLIQFSNVFSLSFSNQLFVENEKNVLHAKPGLEITEMSRFIPCVCVWQIKATSKNRKTKSTHSERSDECFVNQTNYSKSRTNEVEIYRLSRHFCHTEFNTC